MRGQGVEPGLWRVAEARARRGGVRAASRRQEGDDAVVGWSCGCWAGEESAGSWAEEGKGLAQAGGKRRRVAGPEKKEKN